MEATEEAVPQQRLQIEGLNKRFGANEVLTDVRFAVAPGEIHGLVGQNGSGKSTIVKILAGYHTPGPGSVVTVDGEYLPLPPRPRDLAAAGVSLVHQDLGLLDHLTVAENICVGQYECSRFLRRISRAQLTLRAEQVMDRLGVSIDTTTPVSALAPAQRAIVAIARCLLTQRSGKGLIILDEATRALPPDTLEDVHRVLRSVAANGGSVLLVSHNLEEVRAVASRATVLRDGKVVEASVATSEASERRLAQLMLGYELAAATPTKKDAGPGARLRVERLSGPTTHDLKFDVAPGEIVGLTGLPGSGFEEVPYLLAGSTKVDQGAVIVDGKRQELQGSSVKLMSSLGIALVPERRERDGLAFDMSVLENISLPRLVSKGRPYLVGSQWRMDECEDVIEMLGVRPPEPQALVRELSGGNQQKVLLGKWLVGKPTVLIVHEPTQAVDVGARRDLLYALADIAHSGVAVVMASVEAADLAALCHRVLVFRNGSIATTLTAPSAEDIIDAIYDGRLERSLVR